MIFCLVFLTENVKERFLGDWRSSDLSTGFPDGWGNNGPYRELESRSQSSCGKKKIIFRIPVAPRLVWDPAYGLRTGTLMATSQVCFPLNIQAWELRIMTTNTTH